MSSPGLLHPALGASLADYTCEALIRLRLQGTDPTSVIQELAQALQHEGRIADLLPFYHAALNREFLSSTATGSGLAFPHARLPGLTQTSMAVGRCEPPVAWGGRGGVGVRMVFLLAVPATESTEYLLLLSTLAKLDRERSVLEGLALARTPVEMLRRLSQVHVNPRRPSTG